MKKKIFSILTFLLLWQILISFFTFIGMVFDGGSFDLYKIAITPLLALVWVISVLGVCIIAYYILCFITNTIVLMLRLLADCLD